MRILFPAICIAFAIMLSASNFGQLALFVIVAMIIGEIGIHLAKWHRRAETIRIAMAFHVLVAALSFGLSLEWLYESYQSFNPGFIPTNETKLLTLNFTVLFLIAVINVVYAAEIYGERQKPPQIA